MRKATRRSAQGNKKVVAGGLVMLAILAIGLFAGHAGWYGPKAYGIQKYFFGAPPKPLSCAPQHPYGNGYPATGPINYSHGMPAPTPCSSYGGGDDCACQNTAPAPQYPTATPSPTGTATPKPTRPGTHGGKPTKDSKHTRDSKHTQDSKDTRGSRDTRGSKDNHDTRGSRDSRGSRGSRDSRNTRQNYGGR
jgi:hypothetical protein